MKTKFNVNVDKLKISYIQPVGLFNTLAAHQEGDIIKYDDFSLQLLDDGKSNDPEKIQTRVIVSVLNKDWEKMGQLTLHQSGDFGNRAFFECSNKLLYRGSKINGVKYNDVPEWYYAADKLGLSASTITKIDLALDANKNLIARTRKLIKHFKDYEMFVNGKKVTDEKINIQGCNLIYNTSRVQMSRLPTLYFRQRDDDGLRQRIYNKSEEIKQNLNDKKYIEDWNEFGEGETTYRNEVSVGWGMFKEWLAWLALPHNLPACVEWRRREAEPMEHYICRTIDFFALPEYRIALWHWAAARLVYWRSVATNERIDQLDLLR